MNDQPEDMTLVWMRRLDAKFDRLGLRLDEVVERQNALDLTSTAARRDDIILAEAVARVQITLGRVDKRLERIERRLDLIDEPVG